MVMRTIKLFLVIFFKIDFSDRLGIFYIWPAVQRDVLNPLVMGWCPYIFKKMDLVLLFFSDFLMQLKFAWLIIVSFPILDLSFFFIFFKIFALIAIFFSMIFCTIFFWGIYTCYAILTISGIIDAMYLYRVHLNGVTVKEFLLVWVGIEAIWSDVIYKLFWFIVNNQMAAIFEMIGITLKIMLILCKPIWLLGLQSAFNIFQFWLVPLYFETLSIFLALSHGFFTGIDIVFYYPIFFIGALLKQLYGGFLDKIFYWWGYIYFYGTYLWYSRFDYFRFVFLHDLDDLYQVTFVYLYKLFWYYFGDPNWYIIHWYRLTKFILPGLVHLWTIFKVLMAIFFTELYEKAGYIASGIANLGVLTVMTYWSSFLNFSHLLDLIKWITFNSNYIVFGLFSPLLAVSLLLMSFGLDVCGFILISIFQFVTYPTFFFYYIIKPIGLSILSFIVDWRHLPTNLSSLIFSISGYLYMQLTFIIPRISENFFIILSSFNLDFVPGLVVDIIELILQGYQSISTGIWFLIILGLVIFAASISVCCVFFFKMFIFGSGLFYDIKLYYIFGVFLHVHDFLGVLFYGCMSLYTIFIFHLILRFIKNRYSLELSRRVTQLVNLQDPLTFDQYFKLNFERLRYSGRNDTVKEITPIRQQYEVVEAYWLKWRSGGYREFKRLRWRSPEALGLWDKRQKTILLYYAFFRQSGYFYNATDYIKHIRFGFLRFSYLSQVFHRNDYFRIQCYNRIVKTRFHRKRYEPLSNLYYFAKLRTKIRRWRYKNLPYSSAVPIGVTRASVYRFTFLPSFSSTIKHINFWFRFFYTMLIYYPILTIRILKLISGLLFGQFLQRKIREFTAFVVKYRKKK